MSNNNSTQLTRRQLKRNLKFNLGQAEFVSDPEANRLRFHTMRPPYIA